MRFRISHCTRYTYQAPVFLEPQYLRFYPANKPHIAVENFKLHISPEPAGIGPRTDAENNIYHQCWFSGSHELLEITVDMEVSVEAINPFAFLPVATENPHPALEIYNQQESLPDDMLVWVNRIMEKQAAEPLALLVALCTAIRRDWDHEVRYENNLLTPAQCFEGRRGSCRDLSWMLINIFRAHNIPARFVSGYSHNPELEEGHELHAWVEIWVPGGGWVGGDPSAGILVNEQYIPIAASYHPAYTLPVQGSYRGTAHASLDTWVRIEEV